MPLLYSKYKDRDSSKKPIKLKEIRELIQSLYKTVSIDNYEADDCLAIAQYKGRKDYSFIAITEDKDNKAVDGFMYIPRKREIIDCRGFGKIELITKISASDKKSYKIERTGQSFLLLSINMWR